MPNPKGKVIEGVPRVQFYAGGPRPPEDDTFSACMTALLQHRGDDLGLGGPGMDEDEMWHEVHCFFMGMGGSAFKLAFDESLDLASTSLRSGVSSLRNSLCRALEGAGYATQIVFLKPQGSDTADPWTEPQAKMAISQSLSRGWPVIALGLAGPPEFSIIAGATDDLDELIGWSFFQDDPSFSMGMEKEPNGMFRVSNWFKDIEALAIIGEKTAAPAPSAYLAGLEAGLRLLKTDSVGGGANGQAAYRAWCQALAHHDLWPSGSDAALRRSHTYHWQTAGTLAEDRAWGAVFLSQAAEALPRAAEELKAARHCFMNIHDLVWAVWEFSGPFPSMESGAPRFADPGRRARVVPLIRLMAEQDEKAARLIESALGNMGPS